MSFLTPKQIFFILAVLAARVSYTLGKDIYLELRRRKMQAGDTDASTD